MASSDKHKAARSLTLVLNYACNNACAFCFTGPERERGARALSPAAIARVFGRNAARRACGKLVLSGEPTLYPALPALVGAALERGGFRSVTVQTNARLLADKKYCAEVVRAGASEFLVSVHAATPAVNARVTGRAAGLAQTRRGIRNLLREGAEVVTNTVASSLNYRQLPAIAAMLARDGVRKSVFWAFLDTGAPGQADCHVRFADCVPPLLKAVKILRSAGAEVALSGFPRCLLGKAGPLLREYAEGAVAAAPSFSRRMEREKKTSCFYRGCAWLHNGCPGFRKRYLDRFGDERAALRPKLAAPGAGGGR